MNEKRITRKQFLKAVIAAPALKLIGAGGDFYEIDYEGGACVRWIDDYGREVWLGLPDRYWRYRKNQVVIVNGDWAFLYSEQNDAWLHVSTYPKWLFHMWMGIWDDDDWKRWGRGEQYGG